MTAVTATAARLGEGNSWAALRRPVATVAAAAGALMVVATVDPHEPGHYPACPFHAVTGLSCPGCGSLRAIHTLIHGDLLGAIARNALTVAAAPLLVWLWVRWARRCWTGGPRRQPAPAIALWGLLAVVLTFWAARNLPFGAALAP